MLILLLISLLILIIINYYFNFLNLKKIILFFLNFFFFIFQLYFFLTKLMLKNKVLAEIDYKSYNNMIVHPQSFANESFSVQEKFLYLENNLNLFINDKNEPIQFKINEFATDLKKIYHQNKLALKVQRLNQQIEFGLLRPFLEKLNPTLFEELNLNVNDLFIFKQLNYNLEGKTYAELIQLQVTLIKRINIINSQIEKFENLILLKKSKQNN